ncbi:hypothetical protein C4571_03835 [Candidatus Parcubacteria bacterium]|nr:MAG: hypothetical protein C4571_03835 [Candidatus Parcubacteria bacterium]
MAKIIQKRGGRKEAFKKSKLVGSIGKALRDAHISGSRKKRVLGKVSRAVLKFARSRKTLRASDLGKKVVNQLRRVEPAAARAWLAYDRRRRARRAKGKGRRRRR